MLISKPDPDGCGGSKCSREPGAVRRHTWSAEEKAAFVESWTAGETVCGVARHHEVTQQLLTWQRRKAKLRSATENAEPLSVPAVVDGQGLAAGEQIGNPPIVGRVEIAASLCANAPAGAIAAVLRALKSTA